MLQLRCTFSKCMSVCASHPGTNVVPLFGVPGFRSQLMSREALSFLFLLAGLVEGHYLLSMLWLIVRHCHNPANMR